MMVIALALSAWIIHMKTLDVQPRILADNLRIFVDEIKEEEGPHAVRQRERYGYLRRVEVAFDQTHAHLHALGARIVPTKCYTFVSSEGAKSWLRQRKWRRLRRYRSTSCQ